MSEGLSVDDIVCSSCGTRQHPAAAACSECGASFIFPPDLPVEKKQRRGGRRRLIIFVVAAAVLLAAAAVVAAPFLVR
jgi:hypothetical protein